MKRFHALVIVLSLGTTGLLANVSRIEMPTENREAQLAADGAFRDGLYVGRLTAEGGRESRPNVGRWSTDKDRAMFAAGYRRGYTEFLASAGTTAEQSQPAR